MTRRHLVTLGCAALVGLLASSASAQSKWWNADKSKQELGLSSEQSQQLEQIYQAMLPKLRTAKQELDRQEAHFSELMKRDSLPESDVMAVIDRLEGARGDLRKLRTVMLYQMRRVLTPDQRAKLEAEHERDHPQTDGSGRPRMGRGRAGPR